MIKIITGASHTGKTVLAQRLLERYGWPYMSIDHLKMGAYQEQFTQADERVIVIDDDYEGVISRLVENIDTEF